MRTPKLIRLLRFDTDLRRKLAPWLLLAPAILVIGVQFVGGLVFGALQSFGFFSLINSGRHSVDAYIQAFNSQPIRAGFFLTFKIALLSTGLSVIFAFSIAVMISRTHRFQRFFSFIAQLNIPIPHLVAATSVLLMFSQSGVISRVLAAMGLITQPADFPAIVNDSSGTGIILSYLWKEIPFMTVIIISALRGPLVHLDEVAKTLGASYRYRLQRVLIPYLAPAIVSGSILVFAFSFGSYEVPYLLGQPYPAPLSVVSYQFYDNTDLTYRPIAMVVSLFIAALSGLAVLAYLNLSKRVFGRAA